MTIVANVRPPKSGTKTGRVWEIGEAITKERGRIATRAEVTRKYADEGGNLNTANTQYGPWRTHYEARSAANDDYQPQPESIAVQVREAGRIVVPVEFRNALKISEGDTLSARVVDGEIRLMPLSAAIRKAQELVRQFIPAGTSIADDLIADRKVEGRE